MAIICQIKHKTYNNKNKIIGNNKNKRRLYITHIVSNIVT